MRKRTHKWSTFLPIFLCCGSHYYALCACTQPGGWVCFWQKHSKQTQGDLTHPCYQGRRCWGGLQVMKLPQRKVLKHWEPSRPAAPLFWEQIQGKDTSQPVWSLVTVLEKPQVKVWGQRKSCYCTEQEGQSGECMLQRRHLCQQRRNKEAGY